MKRFRLIGVSLLAMFALGIVASSAQAAETAPYFTVGGTRLVAGKTHNIDAKVFNGKSFTLTNSIESVTITCKALGTENATLLGSNFGEPGKDNEITVFSGCKLESGNGVTAGCKLESEVIKTEPLKSEQVENVESGHGGKQLLEEFLPANPAAGFVTLHFAGGSPPCIFNETIVSGQVVAEVLKDNASEEKIELGQAAAEGTSTLLKFPATSIKEVWLISNGVGKIQKTKQVSFGSESVQTGTALVLLASTKFVPEPAAKWSALP